MRIRDCGPPDVVAVGRLIASTYAGFNLVEMNASDRTAMLGPFANAGSDLGEHQRAIADVLRAEIVLVAEIREEIVGVLRGRSDRLQSLFVAGDRHRQGIGRRLVESFERRIGPSVVRVAATLYAVPFYQALGYRKTTGRRTMRSFSGKGLPYQPMRKVIGDVP